MSSIPRTRQRPLKVYVLVGALLMAAPLVFAYWSITEHRAERLAANLDRAESVALFFEKNVAQQFNYGDSYIRSLRRTYLFEGGLEAVKKYMAAVPLDKTVVSHATVIGPDGTPLFVSGHKIKPGSTAKDREYFKTQKSATEDDLLISKPRKGRNTGKVTIRLVRRITLPSGAFGGVVFAAMEVKTFTAFLKAHHLGPDSTAALVGTDKVLRARSNYGKGGVAQILDDSVLWDRLKQGEAGIFREASVIDGVERHYAYRQLKRYPMVVMIGVSNKAVAQWDEKASQQAAIAALLSLIAISGVFLYWRKGSLGVQLENEVERQTEALRGEIAEREKSDQRFRHFSEASADRFWEMDENLRFSFFYDRFEEVTGVPPAMLLGKTREETGVPDVDPDVWREQLDDLAAHRLFRGFEHPRTMPDGSVVHLSINGVPVYGEEGRFLGYRGTGSEITDRINAEAALRRARDDLERAMEVRTAELQTSRRRFEDFAETTADWFWETDEELRFTYVSKNVEHALGIPAELHYGKTHENIIDPEIDLDLWTEHLDTLVARKPFRDFTFCRRGADAEQRWVRTSGKPVYDADGAFRGYHGTGTDVTTSVRREVALQESEKNLREILEKSPVGVAIIKYAEENGRLLRKRLFVNDALVKMFGYGSPEAMMAGGDAYIGSWVDPAQLESFNERIKAGDNVVDFQAEKRRLDRTEWVVSIDTRSVLFDNQNCVMVWHHDITERVRAERALVESVEQHRVVTDSLPVSIIYIGVDERYRFVNETAAHWFARERSELIGRTIEEVHPADYLRFKPYIDRVIGGESFTYEDTITYGDGVTRDVQIIYVPHISATREVVGYFALVEDITDRKQAEAALHQAQKMEAVGQLTGGVAYDFNNLLGVIVANLDFLAEDLVDDAEKLSMIESAIQAAENGATLNRQLLAFSRKQALQTDIVDLSDHVHGMSEMLSRTLGETISIQTVAPSDLRKVEVDSRQLETALLNLAVNARHAMPDGGQLTIETVNVEFGERYAEEHDDLKPGVYAMLAVSDTGTGMPPEVLEHVFEPFFTTKDVGQGSGLGLSMVFGFVKQSGGHVSIYSEEGEGTTVKLYFPVSDTTEAAREMPAQEALPHGSGQTVLIVEDDENLRKVAVRTVSSLGYQVIAVPDGLAALAKLDEGAKVDLLFTDVVLPHGMNGVELGKAASKRHPGPTVLYTSGYTENAINRNGVHDEDIELLDKPYRRTELAHLLRKVMDHR